MAVVERVKAFENGFVDRISELERTVETLTGLISGFSLSAITQMKSDLEELKLENATLKGELSAYRETKVTSSEFNKLQVDYNKLKGVNASLRVEIRDLTQQLNNLKPKVEIKDREVVRLAETIKDSEQTIKIQDIEIEDNKKEIELLHKSLELSEVIISRVVGVDVKVDKIIELLGENVFNSSESESGFNVNEEVFNDIVEMLQAHKSTVVKSNKNKQVIRTTPEEIEKNIKIATDLIENRLKKVAIAEAHNITPQNLQSKQKTLKEHKILDLVKDSLNGLSVADLRSNYPNLQEYIDYIEKQ